MMNECDVANMQLGSVMIVTWGESESVGFLRLFLSLTSDDLCTSPFRFAFCCLRKHIDGTFFRNESILLPHWGRLNHGSP